MQKPSERHKLTSGNNITRFKKPVHDPFNLEKLKDQKAGFPQPKSLSKKSGREVVV